MLKVIWLLKRKKGITTGEFRDRYERHAKLAQKYFGHLMTGYKRNYLIEPRGDASGPDCIGEWIMSNEEALNEINRILGDPVIWNEFEEDMEDFLDKDAVMFKCEEVDTGAGDGHATLALNRKIGELS